MVESLSLLVWSPHIIVKLTLRILIFCFFDSERPAGASIEMLVITGRKWHANLRRMARLRYIRPRHGPKAQLWRRRTRVMYVSSLSLLATRNLADGWIRIAATAEFPGSGPITNSSGDLYLVRSESWRRGWRAPNMRNLADRLGHGATEILDEFLVATVRAVDAPATMAASLTGAVH